MKSRLFFWILRNAQYAAVSLVAVLAASSCASAGTSAPALPTVESVPAPQATLAPTSIADIQIVPTSRGPNLEATDPATVSLAAGQLQLVEFFRFT